MTVSKIKNDNSQLGSVKKLLTASTSAMAVAIFSFGAASAQSLPAQCSTTTQVNGETATCVGGGIPRLEIVADDYTLNLGDGTTPGDIGSFTPPSIPAGIVISGGGAQTLNIVGSDSRVFDSEGIIINTTSGTALTDLTINSEALLTFDGSGNASSGIFGFGNAIQGNLSNTGDVNVSIADAEGRFGGGVNLTNTGGDLNFTSTGTVTSDFAAVNLTQNGSGVVSATVNNITTGVSGNDGIGVQIANNSGSGIAVNHSGTANTANIGMLIQNNNGTASTNIVSTGTINVTGGGFPAGVIVDHFSTGALDVTVNNVTSQQNAVIVNGSGALSSVANITVTGNINTDNTGISVNNEAGANIVVEAGSVITAAGGAINTEAQASNDTVTVSGMLSGNAILGGGDDVFNHNSTSNVFYIDAGTGTDALNLTGGGTTITNSGDAADSVLNFETLSVSGGAFTLNGVHQNYTSATFTGGTTTIGGDIQTPVIDIQSGAAITGVDGGQLTGTVTDAGALTVSGGTFTVDGDYTQAATGDLTLAGAGDVLNITGATTLGGSGSIAGNLQAATVDVVSGANITGNGGGSITGIVNNAGTFGVSGGTFTVNGDYNHNAGSALSFGSAADILAVTGAFNLNNDLTLAGALQAATVDIASGQTLTGNGGASVLGNLTNNGDLTLSGGAFTVDGDYTQTAGGTLSLAAGIDMLVVSGQATLDGALAVSNVDATSNDIVLIDTTGGIVGAFTTITGLVDQTVEVDADTNNLVIVGAPSGFNDLSVFSGNTLAIASDVDTQLKAGTFNDSLATVLGQLAVMGDNAAVTASLDDIAPSIIDVAIQSVNTTQLSSLNSLMQDAIPNPEEARFWFNAKSSELTQDSGLGFETDTLSYGGGISNLSFIEGQALNLRFDAVELDSTTDGLGTDNIESELFNLAGQYSIALNAGNQGPNGAISLGGYYATGTSDIDAEAVIGVVTAAQSGRTSFDTAGVQLRYTLSGFNGNSLPVQPFVSYGTNNITQDAFRLSSTDVGLEIGEVDLTRTTFGIGANLDHMLTEKFRIVGSVAQYQHDGDTASEINSRFIGGTSAGFVTNGLNIESQTLLDLGASYQINDAWAVRATGVGQFGDIEETGVYLQIGTNLN